MAGEIEAVNRNLLRKQVIFTRVLELWRGGQGKHSTFCIADALNIDEAEVCHIIAEAEGRAESLVECGR